MRALTGELLLEAWGRGVPQSDLDRAVTLLAAALPERSEEDPAALSMPERDLALLRLHQLSFGDSLRGYVPCSSCGERLEFELSASSMVDRLEAVKPRLAATWQAEGIQFSMRPADSRDVAAAASQDDSERARRLLLERCTTPPRLECREETAVRTFNELHEGAEILLSMSCPACERGYRVDLDIARFLWSEVRYAALGLLRQVHALASAYGWSESAILAMDGARRAVYLDMARP